MLGGWADLNVAFSLWDPGLYPVHPTPCREPFGILNWKAALPSPCCLVGSELQVYSFEALKMPTFCSAFPLPVTALELANAAVGEGLSNDGSPCTSLHCGLLVPQVPASLAALWCLQTGILNIFYSSSCFSRKVILPHANPLLPELPYIKMWRNQTWNFDANWVIWEIGLLPATPPWTRLYLWNLSTFQLGYTGSSVVELGTASILFTWKTMDTISLVLGPLASKVGWVLQCRLQAKLAI